MSHDRDEIAIALDPSDRRLVERIKKEEGLETDQEAVLIALRSYPKEDPDYLGLTELLDRARAVEPAPTPEIKILEKILGRSLGGSLGGRKGGGPRGGGGGLTGGGSFGGGAGIG